MVSALKPVSACVEDVPGHTICGDEVWVLDDDGRVEDLEDKLEEEADREV